ncbi:MAG TPA: endonuclease/exonuclease/phosphatase family protein [Anditalea sp.]|nr:endonuclease/exonuclease/phosphatase family protein [Anditalea sp.]
MKNFTLTYLLFLIIGFSGCQEKNETVPDIPDEGIKSITSLKIMTYNVHYCNPPSMPASFIDVDAIVNVINAEKPDLIALQEIDVNVNRSGNIHQAQLIGSKLHMRYFFAKAIDFQGGDYGVLILSKYPISETTIHRLPTLAGSGGEPRVFATAKVTLPDGLTLRFGNTHLDAQQDHTNRNLQMDKILDIVKNDDLPFIIAGDFNAVPGTEVIKKLDSAFTRTCEICPPTIPVLNPTRAIDFIAYTDDINLFKTSSHKVINETYASDHRPVVSVLDLNQ